MKDRRDLAEEFTNDPLGWVRRQGTIEGLDLVDLTSRSTSWSDLNVEEVKARSRRGRSQVRRRVLAVSGLEIS